MSHIPHFLVVGAGSWGTALAVLMNRAGSRVTMWTRNDHVYDMIHSKRVNEVYLPDVFLDPEIGVTRELLNGCHQIDYLLLAVPSQQIRPICITLSDQLASDVPIIIAAKGIERGSLMLMHEVVRAILPNNPVIVLSGPNFAQESANGLPTATVVAGAQRSICERVMFAMSGKYFRPYYSDDPVGVQIGGALKNVIAIACGIAVGKGLGENGRAALITRGLAEMQRLAKLKGGKQETLAGLSGLGDLLLSCTSRASRNMSFGYALGQGETLEKLMSMNRSGLTEGVATAESAYQLSRQLGVAMPICSAVYEILHNDADINQTIDQLLSRPLSEE